jgi:hypothetical protein
VPALAVAEWVDAIKGVGVKRVVSMLSDSELLSLLRLLLLPLLLLLLLCLLL